MVLTDDRRWLAAPACCGAVGGTGAPPPGRGPSCTRACVRCPSCIIGNAVTGRDASGRLPCMRPPGGTRCARATAFSSHVPGCYAFHDVYGDPAAVGPHMTGFAQSRRRTHAGLYPRSAPTQSPEPTSRGVSILSDSRDRCRPVAVRCMQQAVAAGNVAICICNPVAPVHSQAEQRFHGL